MIGMNLTTGKALSNKNYVVQLVFTLLSIRLESLVMRRNFGCMMFDFVDSKNNEFYRALIVSVVASCFTSFKYYRPSSVSFEYTSTSIIIKIDGFLLDAGVYIAYPLVKEMIINQYIYKKNADLLFDLSDSFGVGTGGEQILVDRTGKSTFSVLGSVFYSSSVTVNSTNTLNPNNSMIFLYPQSNFSFQAFTGVTIEVDWIASSQRPSENVCFIGTATNTGGVSGFFFLYDELAQSLVVYERERDVLRYSIPVSVNIKKSVAICIYITNGFAGLCNLFVNGIKVSSGNFTNPHANSIEASDKVTILSSLYGQVNSDYFANFKITKGIIYT